MGYPQWMQEGWEAAGPRRCRCPWCLAEVSTNAKARAAHKRDCSVRNEPQIERPRKSILAVMDEARSRNDVE